MGVLRLLPPSKAPRARCRLDPRPSSPEPRVKQAIILDERRQQLSDSFLKTFVFAAGGRLVTRRLGSAERKRRASYAMFGMVSCDESVCCGRRLPAGPRIFWKIADAMPVNADCVESERIQANPSLERIPWSEELSMIPIADHATRGRGHTTPRRTLPALSTPLARQQRTMATSDDPFDLLRPIPVKAPAAEPAGFEGLDLMGSPVAVAAPAPAPAIAAVSPAPAPAASLAAAPARQLSDLIVAQINAAVGASPATHRVTPRPFHSVFSEKVATR